MKILQRNLNRSTFVVWEMKRIVSVVCVCSAPNYCDTEHRSASQPGSVANGTLCIIWYTRSVLDVGQVFGDVCPNLIYQYPENFFVLRVYGTNFHLRSFVKRTYIAFLALEHRSSNGCEWTLGLGLLYTGLYTSICSKLTLRKGKICWYSIKGRNMY